ncbi:MAG: tetratricopeptide repeat protein [Chthoniobacterales bacterium]
MIQRTLLFPLFVFFITLRIASAQSPTATPSPAAVATPATPVADSSASPSASPAKPVLTPVEPMKAAQYRGLLEDANTALNKKQYDVSLAALQKAETLLGPSSISLNLKGAVLVAQKKFDDALVAYNKALTLDPKFFPAQYNVGDADFQQAHYQKAADYFKKLLEEYPNNELLQFMIFLCYVELDNKVEAQKWMETIPFPSNTPSWYYAKAVWEIKNGHKNEATEYLNGSSFIFGDQNELFNRTLTSVNLLPIK